MSNICVYADSAWAGDMTSQRRTHRARVQADHTVTALSTVHIAQGFHGNAAWPCVTLCHCTWEIMKEWVPGAATVNKETWQKSKKEEIIVLRLKCSHKHHTAINSSQNQLINILSIEANIPGLHYSDKLLTLTTADSSPILRQVGPFYRRQNVPQSECSIKYNYYANLYISTTEPYSGGVWVTTGSMLLGPLKANWHQVKDREKCVSQNKA